MVLDADRGGPGIASPYRIRPVDFYGGERLILPASTPAPPWATSANGIAAAPGLPDPVGNGIEKLRALPQVGDHAGKGHGRTEVTVPGSHFIQEGSGPANGRAVAEWMKANSL
jgi:hypothetical protein